MRRLISMGIDMGIILIFEVFFYSLIGEALFKSTYVSVGVAYFIGIPCWLSCNRDGAGVRLGRESLN